MDSPPYQKHVGKPPDHKAVQEDSLTFLGELLSPASKLPPLHYKIGKIPARQGLTHVRPTQLPPGPVLKAVFEMIGPGAPGHQ